MNLITREAVELHFEGATYGPVEHTEALAMLLYLLRPASVRCVGKNGKFEAALRNLLAEATQVTDQIEDALSSNHDDDPVPAGFSHWVGAAWGAVPQDRRAGIAQRIATVQASLRLERATH